MVNISPWGQFRHYFYSQYLITVCWGHGFGDEILQYAYCYIKNSGFWGKVGDVWRNIADITNICNQTPKWRYLWMITLLFLIKLCQFCDMALGTNNTITQCSTCLWISFSRSMTPAKAYRLQSGKEADANMKAKWEAEAKKKRELEGRSGSGGRNKMAERVLLRVSQKLEGESDA